MTANYTIYIVALLTFISAVALIEALYMGWSSLDVDRKIKVKQRLRMLSAAGVTHRRSISLLREPKMSNNPSLNRLMLKVPRLHILDRMLERAGLEFSVSDYLVGQVILTVILVIVIHFFVHLIWLLALAIGVVVGGIMPYLFVVSKREQRMEKLTDQLPDTMDYIARSMRAGNPFTASLKGASLEMQEPIAGEISTTFDEMNFGLDLDDALTNLSERTGSKELRYFITAVLIQRATGGNLAEVLTRIAGVIRSRAALRRDVGALSAEMNYSAKVLIGMPFLVALILHITNPGYLDELVRNRMGMEIVAAQLVLLFIGATIIKKMINFRV